MSQVVGPPRGAPAYGLPKRPLALGLWVPMLETTREFLRVLKSD